MLTNEHHFLGTAKYHIMMATDRDARLPTEMKEFDTRKGLRKDPEHGPLGLSLNGTAWKVPLS